MPLFGAHMAIAKGLHKAVEAAQALGMGTVQIFTGNPARWPTPPAEPPKRLTPEQFLTKNASQRIGRDLGDEEAHLFRHTLSQSGLRHATSHASYLINLASPDEGLQRRSMEATLDELQRAERLGLSYLVLHPGAHMESGEEAGLARVAAALDEVHARTPDCRVRILLETTAGQGTTLGHRFEHLGRIRELVAQPGRLGFCFDTCHVFAAGYSLAPAKEYKATLRAFDAAVGLEHLHVFHVNDSRQPLGSRVDRHAHIGQGKMGLEPFRLLVNDPRFRDHPMILETPKEEGEEEDMDTVNLATLRGLVTNS